MAGKTVSNGKSRRSIAGGLLLILVGVILWGGFNTGMEATNTLDFCISCHEMESTVYQEYKHTVHASNPSGVQASCPDCHVPREWFPKLVRKIRASAEVYHWLAGTIDTREKFEARRPLLAQRVWDTMQKTDSRECRNCHQFSVMDLEGQARFASRIHADAIEAGKTCINCHKGIAHKLPPKAIVEEAVAVEVDMEYGEEINETCAGCHGESGEGSIDGEYPRIAGLNAEYLADQLRKFKKRERLNIPMVPYTNDRELPEEDILAIAGYLSSIELPTKLRVLEEGEADSQAFDALGRLEASRAVINIARYPGNVDAGKRVYRKECRICHGESGEGTQDGLIPPLAGQRSVYLKKQVENFRKGERLHDDPRDAEIFSQCGEGEIDDILAFLSVQDD